jgi:hypothetical protein
VVGPFSNLFFNLVIRWVHVTSFFYYGLLTSPTDYSLGYLLSKNIHDAHVFTACTTHTTLYKRILISNRIGGKI